MLDFASREAQDHEPGAVAWFSRDLGDQVLRKVEGEVLGAHRFKHCVFPKRGLR